MAGMSAAVYSEPTYLHPAPTTAVLSEARPLRLANAALLSLNYLLDELLHLFIHAALVPPPSSNRLSVSSSSPPGPLGPNEVLTTERFKAGVIRVVGPHLGKNAVLEAELAIRELLRMGAPSLRGDSALRKTSFGSPASSSATANATSAATAQADELFRSLRAYVQAISGLGAACPPTGPATLTNHLLSHSPAPLPPSPASTHLTFLTALYAERCITYIADYLLRAVGRVAEQQSGKEAAGLTEVEAAVGEDESLWSWVRGMRVRIYIESELAGTKARSSGSQGGHGSANNSPSWGRRAAAANGRASHESVGSATGLVYGKKDPGMGLAIQEDDDSFSAGFEQLMQSGKTMKVSLTPNRLKTMEKFERSRLNTPPQTPLTPSISMPNISGSTSSSPSSLSSNARRLKARTARGTDPLEEDEEEDDFGVKRRPKESLMDLLNSNPPWPENKSPAPPTRRNEGASLQQNGHDALPTPSSTSPRMQKSMPSSASDDFSPKPLQRPMKAKDERVDLGRERQINHDLVDFFASAPPPVELSLAKEEETISPKKKSGLRGFMSKIGGNKKDDGSSSPTQEDFRLSRKPSLSSMPSGSIGRKSTRSFGTSSAAESAALAAATAAYSPPPSMVSASPPSSRIVSPRVLQNDAAPPLPQSSRFVEPDLSVPAISLPRKTPSAASSNSSSHTNKAPVVPSTNGTSSRHAISSQALAALSDSPLPATPTPHPAPSIPIPTEPIPIRKVASSRSIASTDTGVPASFKTANGSSRPGSASSEMHNGVSISESFEQMPLVGTSASLPSKTAISDDVPPLPSRRADVIAAVGVATVGAVGLAGGLSKVVPSGAVAPASNGEASLSPSLDARRLSNDAATLSGRKDSAPPSIHEAVVDPTIVVTEEEDDEEPLPPGSTLETLKLRMAAATSPQECVALLEALIRQEKKEHHAGHRNSLVEAAKMDANARAVAEQARFDERVQGSLVEFLLGGNDLRPYSPPGGKEVEEEVGEERKGEVVVEEKKVATVEEEVPVEGGAEARMPGEFAMGSAMQEVGGVRVRLRRV